MKKDLVRSARFEVIDVTWGEHNIDHIYLHMNSSVVEKLVGELSKYMVSHEKFMKEYLAGPDKDDRRFDPSSTSAFGISLEVEAEHPYCIHDPDHYEPTPSLLTGEIPDKHGGRGRRLKMNDRSWYVVDLVERARRMKIITPLIIELEEIRKVNLYEIEFGEGMIGEIICGNYDRARDYLHIFEYKDHPEKDRYAPFWTRFVEIFNGLVSEDLY